MSLEVLLTLSCYFSTTVYTQSKDNACMKAGEAYYVYKHLDTQVKEIERHIPVSFVFTATLLSSIEQKRASIPIYGGTYFGVEVPNNRDDKLTIGFEHGF